MKKKTKTLLIVLIVILLFMNNILLMTNTVNAAYAIDKADLYTKGNCGDLLRYNGVTILTAFVVYRHNNVEYPAYCIQKERDGVGAVDGYSVTVDEVVTNPLVWRVITNGYPYKTPQELGVANEKEAFTATKQAVYCVLYDNAYNNFSRYEAIGTAGQRTLNALKKIVNTARNSSDYKPSASVTIQEKGSSWKLDNLNNNYMSRTYAVSSEAPMDSYSVHITSDLAGGLPEDFLVTDLNNNPKNTFSKNEEFKVLLPLNHSIISGELNINVTAKVNTKPILYGKSPSSNLQDYALTGVHYEEGKALKKVLFNNNKTKLTILKRDMTTHEPLEGVEFNVLDKDMKVVYSNLKTDKNGKIVLENMTPGKYYIQETVTVEDYKIYEGLIPITLEFNMEMSVVVDNSKVKEVEIKTNTSEVEVSQEEEKVVIEDKHKETNVNEKVNLAEITDILKKLDINKITNYADIIKLISKVKSDKTINKADIINLINETEINKILNEKQITEIANILGITDIEETTEITEVTNTLKKLPKTGM